MIRFEEITTKNVWDVCRLKVTKEQEDFVSANIESLAEAYAVNNEGEYAKPLAVYDEGLLIGFVMLGYGKTGDEDDPEIAENNYCLWRLMIDVKYQHRGYAKQILDQVVAFAKGKKAGEAEYIWLSYEPENEHGRKTYKKYGFVENGEYCGDEIVAVYKLDE